MSLSIWFVTPYWSTVKCWFGVIFLFFPNHTIFWCRTLTGIKEAKCWGFEFLFLNHLPSEDVRVVFQAVLSVICNNVHWVLRQHSQLSKLLNLISQYKVSAHFIVQVDNLVRTIDNRQRSTQMMAQWVKWYVFRVMPVPVLGKEAK